MSTQTSLYKRGINDILELASNALSGTNKRIQDKTEEIMGKTNSGYNETIQLINLKHNDQDQMIIDVRGYKKKQFYVFVCIY